MPDRRPAASLALGLTGMGAGMVAAATSEPALGLLGGLCALGAGMLGWACSTSRPRSVAAGAASDGDGSTSARSVSIGRPGEFGTPSAAHPGAIAPGASGADTSPSGALRPGDDEGALPSSSFGTAPVAGSLAGRPHSHEPAWAGEGQVLVDPLTSLYSESYLLVALDARIAAARRRLRPVSVVMVEVVRGLSTGRPTPCDPLVVADAVRTTLREADTASRMNDGRYALVLEDTPENGAIWTIERLRTCLLEEHPDYTVWAGVACYPAHAFNLDEILVQATTALEAAKEWRQDRIEVATAE